MMWIQTSEAVKDVDPCMIPLITVSKALPRYCIEGATQFAVIQQQYNLVQPSDSQLEL